MPSLDGITVRILCDGSPLEEYSNSLDPKNSTVVSCWISSLKDKSFSISYEFHANESCEWTCSFECDGIPMRCSRVASGSITYVHDKARNGNELFSLMFSEVVGTDDQEATIHPNNPFLGTIKVEIWRVRLLRKCRTSVIEDETFTLDESPIHESKKILGGHRVSLGQGTPSDRRLSRSTSLDREPYRTFNFHYRPRAMLQALGHVSSIPTLPKGIKRRASKLDTSSPFPQSGYRTCSKSDTKNRRLEVGESSSRYDLAELEQLETQILTLQEELKQLEPCQRASKRRKREVIDLCPE